MSHYYQADPNLDTTEFPITFDVDGRSFTVNSSAGVFSKEGLDTGSRILCETILKEAKPVADFLDLGCGIGVIGVILASFWNSRLVAIDPNSQACHLAEENYAKYNIEATVLNQDHVNDQNYPLIVLNPPIRTGKQVIYSLFEQSAAHLLPGGSLWIVIRKQHGAQSAMDKLNELGVTTRRVTRDKGFWVIEAHKPE